MPDLSRIKGIEAGVFHPPRRQHSGGRWMDGPNACNLRASRFSLCIGAGIPSREGSVDDDQREAALAALQTAATAIDDRKSVFDKALADQIQSSAAFAQVGFAARAPACIGHMDDLCAVRIVVGCSAITGPELARAGFPAT